MPEKPQLETKLLTTVVHKVSHSALDRFVTKVLGFKEYDFAAVEECGNDSDHEFDVTGELDIFEEGYIEKFKDGGFESYSNNAILNYLCREGHCQPGTYIVNVCW